MLDKCTIELKDEAEERYKIKRSYRYGKELNVCKAYEKSNPNVHYVIKSYNTKEGFERELMMLKKLSGAKNITQMVDNYPSQSLIICECALYDLETFLGHQDYTQRHEVRGNIIKDIVSGLLELQKHDIVHTELSPGNIMYFQGNDGCTENWKLIDFDTACFVGSHYVKVKMNYSAPEVIKAQEGGTEIAADFSMDMFSFGLVLYFIETGRHYWDGWDEGVKRDVMSGKKYFLLLQKIRDRTACWVIKSLLDKDISRRMKLDKFMRTQYYTGESKSTDISKFESDYEGLDQTKLMQVIEKYNNEMKESLKSLNDKVDNIKGAVEDLTDLTKQIPQWLVKLQNENVPRVFIIIPDQKDWKKLATWFLSKPFRLLFVCEHKEQYHVPKQDGHKLLEVPQFIKKYGPWINLCLQTLFAAVKVMTSNIFPQGVADILSSVFNVSDNSDLMQYFQEIIDTVDIGVKTMIDEEPTFLPLGDEAFTHQMINDSGLRELERFLDKQDVADKFGGLVRCVDDDNNIIWLCEEHRSGYSPISSVNPSKPLITIESNGPSESNGSLESNGTQRSNGTQGSNGTRGSNGPQTYFDNRELDKLLPIDPQDPEAFPKPPFTENTLKWDYHKFNIENSTDPLDPYYALDYLRVILGEVIENIVESGKKHFRGGDIMEIAQKLRENCNNFADRRWYDSDQKIQFLKVLKNQVHQYNRLIWLIIRYCAVKDRVMKSPSSPLAKKINILCHDIFEISSIIKSGKSFNCHLSKLITALKKHDNTIIQYELKNLAEDPHINLYVNDEPNVLLSQWYYVASQKYFDQIETPTDNGIQEGRLFDTTKQVLNNTTVTGKSLRYLNDENYHCLIKEIYLYNDCHLNNNKYIIEFRGYSIQHCKCTLFYEYADFGDLFDYFQVNHYPSNHHLSDWKNKIKLAWEISLGVKYLHGSKIVHLDLRSANILLKYNEDEKTLTPKISNFLWSRDFYSGKTSVCPIITTPSCEQVWKRWYDPERLSGLRQFQTPTTSTDIYSLGLLFWEIAWCKPKNLPFKEIAIENLYHHLREYNHENLPELPENYQSWARLIDKMWKFKTGDRYDIMTVEIFMRKLYKRSDSSIDSPVSPGTPVSPISPISFRES